MRIGLIIAIVFVLLSFGILSAIAQDASKGVWVLTEIGNFEGNIDQENPLSAKYIEPCGTLRPNLTASGTIVAGKNRVCSNCDCSEKSDCVMYRYTTSSWTPLPPRLKPGDQLKITLTSAVRVEKECGFNSGGFAEVSASYWTEDQFHNVNSNSIGRIHCSLPGRVGEGPFVLSNQSTEAFTYMVPDGRQDGQKLALMFEGVDSGLGRAKKNYWYTYSQGQEASAPASKLHDEVDENHSPTVPKPADEVDENHSPTVPKPADEVDENHSPTVPKPADEVDENHSPTVPKPSDDVDENHSPTVILTYSPSNPTDRDL
jgi:hypothetical protein